MWIITIYKIPIQSDKLHGEYIKFYIGNFLTPVMDSCIITSSNTKQKGILHDILYELESENSHIAVCSVSLAI